MNSFFNLQVLPLIIFCQVRNIIPIIIHEVSYNPDTGKNLAFLHVLYDRIENITITLKYSNLFKGKTMEIKNENQRLMLKYQILDHGFVFKNI
ncbi:MAG: hypothetical protein EU539_14085 [Promethearchaeota archaeon]|nr:MAG: hypothetical protein EU539_14085 [Candidatus Lokiarchaeota archaeon]